MQWLCPVITVISNWFCFSKEQRQKPIFVQAPSITQLMTRDQNQISFELNLLCFHDIMQNHMRHKTAGQKLFSIIKIFLAYFQSENFPVWKHLKSTTSPAIQNHLLRGKFKLFKFSNESGKSLKWSQNN